MQSYYQNLQLEKRVKDLNKDLQIGSTKADKNFSPQYFCVPPSASITAIHLAGIVSVSLTKYSEDTESHASFTTSRSLSRDRFFPLPKLG